jgi:hypothetical protein
MAQAAGYVGQLSSAGVNAHLGSDVDTLGETSGTTGDFDLGALYHVHYSAVSPGLITYNVYWRIDPLKALGGVGAGAAAGSLFRTLPMLVLP